MKAMDATNISRHIDPSGAAEIVDAHQVIEKFLGSFFRIRSIIEDSF